MDLVASLEAKHLKSKLPEFSPGDTVKLFSRIKEGDKERVQIFEGVVIQRKGSGIGASVTVRKVSMGVGVEKLVPLHSPALTRIELVKKGKTRRAKLFYLRKLRGRSARIEEKREEIDKAVSTEAQEREAEVKA